MGFLAGPVTFQCYRIHGEPPKQFGAEHIAKLKKFAIGKVELEAADQPVNGFLAGNHLFDVDFQLEKNVIGQALHCGMRIDSSQIPAAIKKAWMQMESWLP